MHVRKPRRHGKDISIVQYGGGGGEVLFSEQDGVPLQQREKEKGGLLDTCA
jgi:hypothetical protein